VFGRIDHVAMAVEDLDEAVALYQDRLGMNLQHREIFDQFGVEAVLLGIGDGHVELLKPVSPDSGVGRFLERRGPGMHHVAYRTDDIDSALESVRAAGLVLIDALSMEPTLQRYHLLPSVRGDLLEKLGRVDEARAEFERAAALTRNARERELLVQRAHAATRS